ncbi:MAG: hypothetical protein HQM02_13725 [Magnetococcales bacterium]|nr:hypothetical protein [Magnetococcales bacterium]
MKVSIGMRLQPGAWGGGNRFGKALADFLEARGHQVVFDLTARDIDIILLAEPDRKLKISAFDHGDILRYLLFRNPSALVLHRINNTSEARDDPEKRFNRFRILANRVADHTVFVSQWVRERYREAGFGDRPCSIILNGGDHRLWHPSPVREARGARMKLVTHHWSTHPKKGMALYQRLDALLSTSPWSEQLEFTYVGPLPEGVRFQNSRHVPPLAGDRLAEELRGHDIYITAASCEAGPNHVLEGALCGLPLLYVNSGSMAEYCAGFGLEFTPDTLAPTLARMLADHERWTGQMASFPLTADHMCQGYLERFEALLTQRSGIVAARRFWRSLPWVARTLLHRDRRT